MNSLREPSCLQELTSRLERLRPDTPRLWGKMTAPQMICHLTDAFLGIIGEKPMDIPRGFTLWPALKYLVLYSPAKWPHGVPTRPEFDQHGGGGTPPAQFESDVRLLLATMQRFSRRPRDFAFRPHPIFKEMSESQWMRGAISTSTTTCASSADKAGDREQGTGNREQGTGNREQGVRTRWYPNSPVQKNAGGTRFESRRPSDH